ncbi:MAG: hypothetical protein SNJ71_00070 [Bacteroidales bacterium]
MEALLLSIQKRLAEQVIDLVDVDVNWGQLMAEQDYYPVQFPCALIRIDSIVWKPSGEGLLYGDARVTVTVAVSLPGDTHYTSGVAQASLATLEIASKVNAALHRFAGHILPSAADGEYYDNNFSPLCLVASRIEQYSGDVAAIAHTYECAIVSDGSHTPLIPLKGVTLVPVITQEEEQQP